MRVRPCDALKHQRTQARMFERARVLGYANVEDCIRARIGVGQTLTDLAGKLDVSMSTLKKEMDRLGIQAAHAKKVRFWSFIRKIEGDFRCR